MTLRPFPHVRPAAAASASAAALLFSGSAALAANHEHPHRRHRRHQTHHVHHARKRVPAASTHRGTGSSTQTSTSAGLRGHRVTNKPTAHSAGGCGNAHTPASSLSPAAVKDAVVCLVNHERTAHGLPALSQNSHLDQSAQGWTNQMVASQSFSHGSDFAARISAAGYDWSQAGENIATGFQTPQEVVNGWMASQGHCRNILSPEFASVGAGLATRGVKTGPSTWTLDFGLPMGASAPSGNWGPADSVC